MCIVYIERLHIPLAAGVRYLRLELWDKNDLVSDEQMGGLSISPARSPSHLHPKLKLAPSSSLTHTGWGGFY